MHHADGLARASRHDERSNLADEVRKDWREAELTPRERALCAYADKLTRAPGSMAEADLDPLRECGLSDRDILDANLVAAYFAFVNRIADGLGVALEADRR